MITALAAVAVLAAGTAAWFLYLGGGSTPKHPRVLSTTLANQQLAGLADPGPATSSTQRLITLSGGGLSFLAAGGGGSVMSSQQWQADEMTDGSYVLVYVADGKCLDEAGGSSKADASDSADHLALTTCDLGLSQRWSHPYAGKDPAGRDYWQLRSEAAGQCVTAGGVDWRDGLPAQLRQCGNSFGWQQLIEFWSAY